MGLNITFLEMGISLVLIALIKPAKKFYLKILGTALLQNMGKIVMKYISHTCFL